MRHYTFECVDDDENTRTVVEFDTDSDTWSGYDGPMWKFFDFLKGTGFVFGVEDKIGVQRASGGFVDAVDFERSYSDLDIDTDECEDCSGLCRGGDRLDDQNWG